MEPHYFFTAAGAGRGPVGATQLALSVTMQSSENDAVHAGCRIDAFASAGFQVIVDVQGGRDGLSRGCVTKVSQLWLLAVCH